MKGSRFRKFKALGLILVRAFWRQRDFYLRVLIAWTIGLGFYFFDRQDEIDLRLQMRGLQSLRKDIVLVQNSGRSQLKIQPLIETFTKYKTKAVLVTTELDSKIPPHLSLPTKGLKVIPHDIPGDLDWDKVYRRIDSETPEKIALMSFVQTIYPESVSSPMHNKLLNFRGKSGSFPTFTENDILEGRFGHADLEGKLVIIGQLEDQILTPLGEMSKAEVFANVVDNIAEGRWIKTVPPFVYACLLFLAAYFVAWITLSYPQLLTVVILAFFQIGIISVLLFLFDWAYVLVPMSPILIASIASFMIFVSYQLTLTDYEKDQLEKEKRYMIDVEELKHNFLSLISHDLKTPIAKIQGITDRILSRSPDEATKHDANSLISEAEHLNRYIKTLLQVTRAESHGFQLNPDSMDINEVIESVCSELSSLMHAKAIQLDLNLEPMFLIDADPLLMHEVVLNLVENAIKFSHEGGVIKISSREVDGRVIVMVEDNGQGISPLERTRIFEKFYQGESGKIHSKGSGLGLYLVKYFIERHSGHVLVHSEIGKGTQIGFSLPIQSAHIDRNDEGVSLDETNA